MVRSTSLKTGSQDLPIITVDQVALVGNPNAGKTALFNALTGLRAKTANYPGITVDVRKGSLRLADSTVELIDLPGLYSLDAITPEEKVAVNALQGTLPGASSLNVILLVLDATNLERNLFLASEVLDLKLPTIVVLNMMDAAEAAEIKIDFEKLKSDLKCPILPISARTGAGIKPLLAMLDEVLNEKSPTLASDQHVSCTVGCGGCPYVARYNWASKLVEKSVDSPGIYGQTTAKIDTVLTYPVVGILALLTVMLAVFYVIFALAKIPMDLVDQLFGTLKHFVSSCFPTTPVHGTLWGAVAFSLSMSVFAFSYRVAAIPWKKTSALVAGITSLFVASLPIDEFQSLLVEGVLGGIGGVVVFLPQICILFFFISLLEDSGYMARAAFVMERVMRAVGLPGKAFVPMLSAHACAIPGIMAARVIEDWRDRLVTILVLPLLTCSARLPVYAIVASLLFSDSPGKAALVFLGAYLLGIVAALGTAFCLKHTILKGDTVPLVLELPPYRVPSIRNALITVFDRATIFIRQAGTVILMISVILWAMLTYPKMPAEAISPAVAAQLTKLAATESNESKINLLLGQEQLAYSYAGRIGRTVEPVFKPLGFDWKINVGVLSSFAAREVIGTTLAIIYGLGEEGLEDENASFIQTLRAQKNRDGSPVFTTATSLSLLVFFVLAMQCLPTQAVTRRETGSWKWAFFQLSYMTALAYLAAFATYQVTNYLT